MRICVAVSVRRIRDCTLGEDFDILDVGSFNESIRLDIAMNRLLNKTSFSEGKNVGPTMDLRG